MSEGSPSAETQVTVQTTTSQDGAKLSRTRGLMPPWRKGQSGNPSGLTKDGIAPKTHAIQARLLARLAQPSGQRSTKTWADRIVEGWVRAAAKGDAAARRDILERLYPVAAGGDGKQALEAIRLELGPGQASVTLLRGLQGQLPASSSSGDGAGDGASPAG